MTLNEVIHAAVANPDAPLCPEARAVLEQALASAPYCVLPATLLLRDVGAIADSSLRRTLQARVAVLTSDKNALASLAAACPADDPTHFYPAEPAVVPLSTESAIDTFLDTYGSTSPEEEALLEKLIFNPVPDYADILAAEAPAEPAIAPEDTQDAIIDAFLRKETETSAPEPTLPEPAAETATTPPAPDTSLSESLARIFISQGRYGRALEILSDLAARAPEKNPFFADQARYLRKLVALQGGSTTLQ